MRSMYDPRARHFLGDFTPDVHERQPTRCGRVLDPADAVYESVRIRNFELTKRYRDVCERCWWLVVFEPR